MSILKPVEETVDISAKEIKDLIAFDIGVKIEDIDLKVKLELVNGLDYFNNSAEQKATALLATVSLQGKTQKFEIYENDLKKLFSKCLEENFENNNITINYKKDSNGSSYELLSVSVGKKPDLENKDVLFDSLSKNESKEKFSPYVGLERCVPSLVCFKQ